MAEWAWSGWALSFQAAHPQDKNDANPNQRELQRHDEPDPNDPKRPDNSQRVQQLEWPLFPSPTLTSLQVSGYEMYNNSLYYIVSVEMGDNFRWSVLKSYEDFSYLHKILMNDYNMEKQLFPHRKMFGSHKLDNIKDMQQRLNTYLISVLKYFMMPPPQILQFLEYRFSDMLSITQTLSALFYDRGEEFLDTNSMVAFSPVQLHCVCQRLILPIESDLHNVKEEFGHLLDFLQQLKKIKICSPRRKAYKLASDVKLKFDLSIMKSLDTLVLQRINLELVEGLGNIPQSLETLAVHGGLSAMRDILKHPCLIQFDTEGKEARPCSWPALKVIDFSDNDITNIDSSLELVPNLESLNLRNNAVNDIDNLVSLPHLRTLDLSSNRIESLKNLHRRLGNITTLCLAKNALASLQGLEKCYSIVCLDIQHNRLKKVSDLAPLASLPLLEQLMTKGNIFTETPFYRQKVFGQLFQIAPQLSVDGKPPTADELRVSESMAMKESNKKTQKAKKVTTRKASIRLEDDEEEEKKIEEKQSSEQLLNSVGTRRNIEEMRKEGGDNWLTLLNQTQSQTSPLVIHKKHKSKKSGKKRAKGSSKQHSLSPGVGENESSSEYTREQLVSSTGSATGLPSPHLIQILGTREGSSGNWSSSVSVMESNLKIPKMTHQEMEDLLTTSKMEECVIIVDIRVGKITEDYIMPEMAGKNRNTRDLTFLRGVRVHEGTVLALAVELSTMMKTSSWVIYTLKNYPALADIYLLLSRKLKLVDDIQVPSPVLLAKQMSIPDTDSVRSETDGGSPLEESLPKEQSPLIEPARNTNQSRHLSSKEHSLEKSSEEDTHPPHEQQQDVDVLIRKNGENKSNMAEVTSPLESDSTEDELVSENIRHRRSSYAGPLQKPNLGNKKFQTFLMRKVVRDSSEILMHVVWCGLCLPCTIPYQIEGAVVISNDGIYLLEVKGHQNWEWDGKPDDFPLFPIASMKLEHMSRIMVTGMFNLNLYLEVHQGLPISSFVIFLANSDECNQLAAQIKAVLEAANLDFKVIDALEAKNMRKTSGVVFVSPDHFSGSRLKEWLAHDRTNIRLANFISTQMDRSAVGMYEVELQQSRKEMALSFDIEQYLTVLAVDPCSNCKLHTLVLVATNTDILMFEESSITGPGLRFTPAKHAFPPLSLVHYEKISSIKSIILSRERHFVHSPSDPMFHVGIEFKDNVSIPWYFCTREMPTLRSALIYIQEQWNTLLSNDSRIITAVSSPLPYFDTLTNIPSYSPKPEHSHKSSVPRLVKNKHLVRFNYLPYWQKQAVFNDHISQANYLKQDETIVYSELVHCVPLLDRKQEIETCVIISNYAVYLVSDMNKIVQWLDAGGVSSFSRMSLLNPENEYPLQCFYRMWLSDVRKIEVNHLQLSFSLQEVRPNVGVDVLTNNAQVTASFMTALACKIKMIEKQSVEQEMQDFVDLATDPFGDETDPAETLPSPGSVRPQVDYKLFGEKNLTKFKLHLVESQPEVARGSSISKCSESMQIICSQIMLLCEQMRVREVILPHYRPHLVLVTNYGLFVCSNSSLPDNTPCLLLGSPSNIKVKMWSRINDILSVHLSTDKVHNVPQIQITVKTFGGGGKSDGRTQLCLYPLSRAQGYMLVCQLKMIWAERTGITGHALPIYHS